MRQFSASSVRGLLEKLDNEIKNIHLEWHAACGRLTAAQISKAVPSCLPKTNLCHQSTITGISRFDFVKWRAEGQPTLLRAGWIALCKLVADNAVGDPECFRNIISLCNDLAIDNEANPDLKTAMAMSRGSRTAANYRRAQQPSRIHKL